MIGTSASRRSVGACLTFALCYGALVLATVSPSGDLDDGLTAFLIAAAAISNALSVSMGNRFEISGSFAAGMLAVAFLDPASAFAVAVAGEIAAWSVDRYSGQRPRIRFQALPVNIAATGIPNLVAATIFTTVDPDGGGAGFYLLLGGVSVLALTMNPLLVVGQLALLDGTRIDAGLRSFAHHFPALGINLALTLCVASIYDEVGLGGAAFVLIAIVAFAYMARLVITAQERTRQYASLSWGVLSGLLRTLDQRDPRSARHAAAVAAFSRDIAKHLGMGESEQELAHTSGLLHDIGGFGLSDRVISAGRR